jgi:hypothetical protein
MITEQERSRLLAIGPDLVSLWNAGTTTARDKKELLRTLIDEVVVKVERQALCADLTVRWKGGALTEIGLDLPRSRPAPIRTAEDTVALLRRLAAHYPDAVIAGVLNRQGRTTAYGHRFDRNRVGNLRRHWNIPAFRETIARRRPPRDCQAGRRRARRRALDHSSIAQRQRHRRRATHPPALPGAFA